MAEEALPHRRWGVLGVWTLQSWGRGGGTRYLGGFLQTLPLLKDHPFSFPLVGPGQLFKKRGLELAAVAGGPGSHPPVLLGLHTQFPTSAPPLPSFQGREQASPAVGSLACVPVRVLVPTSPTATVLCALGCCAATVGCQ